MLVYNEDGDERESCQVEECEDCEFRDRNYCLMYSLMCECATEHCTHILEN